MSCIIMACILAFFLLMAMFGEGDTKRRQAWVDLASKYGGRTTWNGAEVTLSGRAEGFDFKIWTRRHKSGKTRKRFYYIEVSGLPTGISVGAEGVFFASNDLQIGDKRFDDYRHIKGDARRLRAMLDERARAALLSMDGLEIRSDGTALLSRIRGGDAYSAEASLQRMLKIVSALKSDLSDEQRLVAIALRDSVSGVRAGAIEELGTMGSDLGRTAAKQGLKDADIVVRIASARILGRTDVLMQATTDKTLPAKVRHDLIFELIAGKHYDEPGLIDLLKHFETTVRARAIRALAKEGSIAAVEPLIPLRDAAFGFGAEPRAAGNAIKAIQARLVDAEAGGLSIAKPKEEEGALSLAETGKRGGVSLVKAPK